MFLYSEMIDNIPSYIIVQNKGGKNINGLLKNKSVAYSSQGNHAGQLDFCN
jgi:hypothetical protein